MVWYYTPLYYFYTLYLHNLFVIPTIFCLYRLNSVFNLYLGVNTIQYLHSHFVCDKQLCLFAIINNHPFFILELKLLLFYQEGMIFNCLTFNSYPLSKWLLVSKTSPPLLAKAFNKKTVSLFI